MGEQPGAYHGHLVPRTAGPALRIEEDARYEGPQIQAWDGTATLLRLREARPETIGGVGRRCAEVEDRVPRSAARSGCP